MPAANWIAHRRNDFEKCSAGVKFIILLAFCAGFVALLWLRSSHFGPQSPDWNEPWDHHKYLYMAEHPLGEFHIAPASWRVAIPFVVSLLPVSHLTGFVLIALVSLTVCGPILYYTLRVAHYTVDESLLGVLMFYAYGSATKLLLMDPYHPEAAIFAITIAAFYLMLNSRDILLGVCLLLGVTVKETIIMVIPLIYTVRAQRWIDFKLMLRTAAIGLPALAMVYAIQYWIPAYNENADYVARMGVNLTRVHLGTATFNDSLQRVMAFRLQDTPVNLLRSFTYMSIGILFLLPFFGLRQVGERRRSFLAGDSTAMLALRFFPFLALTFFGWFMALNEDRRFAYAFPIFIMMGLNSLRSLAASWQLSIVCFFPVFLLLFALNLLQPLTPAVPFDLAAAVFVISVGVMFSYRDKLRGVES